MTRPKTPTKIKNCITCKKDYPKSIYNSVAQWRQQKFCSKSCALVGTKRALGAKWTDEMRAEKSKLAKQLKIGSWLKPMFGTDNPSYKVDRTTLSDKTVRNTRKYRIWRNEVKDRDSWTCKINTQECNGRLEVHHILSWREFPELRYVTNNGIALCAHHHPRKRKDEVRLSPYFQSLVTK